MSESTLVKIPHCWKSHVVAHLFVFFHVIIHFHILCLWAANGSLARPVTGHHAISTVKYSKVSYNSCLPKRSWQTGQIPIRQSGLKKQSGRGLSCLLMWIPALKTSILFENRKRKVFEIWGKTVTVPISYELHSSPNFLFLLFSIFLYKSKILFQVSLIKEFSNLFF